MLPCFTKLLPTYSVASTRLTIKWKQFPGQ